VFLNNLVGKWGSRRRKRSISDAIDFGYMLFKHPEDFYIFGLYNLDV